MEQIIQDFFNVHKCNKCIPCYAYDESYNLYFDGPNLFVDSTPSLLFPENGNPTHICQFKKIEEYNTYYIGLFDTTANEWTHVEPPLAPSLIATTPIELYPLGTPLNPTHTYEQRFLSIDNCGYIHSQNVITYYGISNAKRCSPDYGYRGFFQHKGMFDDTVNYDDIADNSGALSGGPRTVYIRMRLMDLSNNIILQQDFGGYIPSNNGNTNYLQFLSDISDVLNSHGIVFPSTNSLSLPTIEGFDIIYNSLMDFGITFQLGFDDHAGGVYWTNVNNCALINSSNQFTFSVAPTGNLLDINSISWGFDPLTFTSVCTNL